MVDGIVLRPPARAKPESGEADVKGVDSRHDTVARSGHRALHRRTLEDHGIRSPPWARIQRL